MVVKKLQTIKNNFKKILEFLIVALSLQYRYFPHNEISLNERKARISPYNKKTKKDKLQENFVLRPCLKLQNHLHFLFV